MESEKGHHQDRRRKETGVITPQTEQVQLLLEDYAEIGSSEERATLERLKAHEKIEPNPRAILENAAKEVAKASRVEAQVNGQKWREKTLAQHPLGHETQNAGPKYRCSEQVKTTGTVLQNELIFETDSLEELEVRS